MLLLKPSCECCDTDLPPDSRDALICSFECTFCRSCADGMLQGRCSKLRGRIAAAADPAGGEACKISGVARARLQTRRLRRPAARP